MKNSHPYLPELDWNNDPLLSDEFLNRYLDAGVKASARGRPSLLQRGRARLQSAQRRVTAAVGWTVLKVTKNPDLCAARGHQLVGRPWKNIPGHYENWHRTVGCECGKLCKIQSCHHWQDPNLSFEEPSP